MTGPTTPARRRESAAGAYTRNHAAVTGRLAQLETLVAGFTEDAGAFPNDWGYVGTIGELSDRLGEAVELFDFDESPAPQPTTEAPVDPPTFVRCTETQSGHLCCKMNKHKGFHSSFSDYDWMTE